jgi:hypothetical protein
VRQDVEFCRAEDALLLRNLREQRTPLDADVPWLRRAVEGVGSDCVLVLGCVPRGM